MSPSAQLTFANYRAQEEPPRVPTRAWREREHTLHRARAERLAEAGNEEAERELRRLEALLLEFLHGLDAGEVRTFFAVDFTDWLHRTGAAPTTFDLRRTTVLFSRLRRRGVITSDGYFPTGGGANSNSCARTRWRIRSIPPPSPSSGTGLQPVSSHP